MRNLSVVGDRGARTNSSVCASRRTMNLEILWRKTRNKSCIGISPYTLFDSSCWFSRAERRMYEWKALSYRLWSQSRHPKCRAHLVMDSIGVEDTRQKHLERFPAKDITPAASHSPKTSSGTSARATVSFSRASRRDCSPNLWPPGTRSICGRGWCNLSREAAATYIVPA